MKIFLVVGWAVVLFILTCNADPYQLMSHHVLIFQWTAHPRFQDLLLISDASFQDAFYLVQKLGHFIGFSILALLLSPLTKSRKWTFAAAVFFAIFTEMMQLYFTRDGRLLDAGIDALGILTAIFIMGKTSGSHIKYGRKHFPR